MNEQIRKILSQITELEDDLYKLIHEQQAELNYRIALKEQKYYLKKKFEKRSVD